MIGAPLLALLALAGSALAAPPAAEEPQPRRLHAGIELIGLWGVALRASYERDKGWLDAVGVRAGFAAGPSPLFADERTLGALFVAPTIDLFSREDWQLEITLGPAAVDVDNSGHALVDLQDGIGVVAGVAGRHKTERPLQINLGPMIVLDHQLRRHILVIDISPSWVF